MKKLKRILMIGITAVIMLGIIVSFDINANSCVVQEKTVKVGVLLYKFDDEYISTVRQNLENIQKENEGKVEFTFFDGKGSEAIQNKSLNDILKSDVDLLLINLVNTRTTKEAIDKVKEKNIPVVLFNREPISVEAIKSYGKACFVGTDAKQAGVLQGQMIAKAWNSDKELTDINRDGIMQYIMLKGERNNLEAIDRTKYSIETINESGIKTAEISSQFCDWDKELAKTTAEELLKTYGNSIEVIIANNDSMAEGAILALQEIGYNKGDKAKTIPVFGVDAIPSAQELIKKGFMTGSVLQDSKSMADALYKSGMNLVNGKSPIDGTDYKFDETGVAIRIPYKEYMPEN